MSKLPWGNKLTLLREGEEGGTNGDIDSPECLSDQVRYKSLISLMDLCPITPNIFITKLSPLWPELSQTQISPQLHQHRAAPN